MSERPAWQARIDREGIMQGAGILVDPEHVLTCAHLVGDHTDFRVFFPKAPQRYQDRAACVSFRGPWRHRDDPGDVAVLKLSDSVDIPPAKLAGPGEWPSPNSPLLVYGFPKGMPGGSYARVTADFEEELQEGIQVGAEFAHLERLQKGFSGGAVYDPGTGTVVGMITDAVKDPAIGRMLPIDLLRRYWERLDELLSLTWLEPEDIRALRAIIVDAQPRTSVEEIYRRMFPGVWKRRDLVSTWDAIRYVAEECVDESSLPRFLIELAKQIPGPIGSALGVWSRSRLAGVVEQAEVGTAPVIIKIESVRDRDFYRVTMFSLIDGAIGDSRPAVQLPEAEVQAYVEGEIDGLIGAVAGRVPVIEFALPESWLLAAVEEWSLYSGQDDPLGAYHPVVVRDVQRMKSGSRQTNALTRWRELERHHAWSPEPIGCHHPDDKGLRSHLAQKRHLGVLAYASQPDPGRLRVALNHGMPVMFWPRVTCPDADHQDCAGARFIRRLTTEVKGIDVMRLPEEIMRLRAHTGSLPQGPHWEYGLTMFWDDPRRIPPPLFMEA